MIQSMTGFGKATNEYAGKKITAEIKSLNSKQMDVNMRISNVYREQELKYRNLITQKLERGKVDFALYVENATIENGVQINSKIIEAYYQQIKNISAQLNIAEPENWFDVLLKMPEVMKSEDVKVEKEEWEMVFTTIENAIEHFNEFRTQEGKSLQTMFEAKLDKIAQLLEEVKQYETDRIDKIRNRIEENLQKLSESSKIDFDRNRLEQEMIFYMEKMDINEEKVRLTNHLNYFRETMATEKAVGKKLGFIAQEMGREINTLGSKSNHSEMQIIVVQMKDELEQIKEQVLNVL